MATAATLEARFTADTSNFQRGQQTVLGGLRTLGGALGLSLGAAAVGKFATDSLNAFTSLDTGMREVFTLLPGISEDAMGDMTNQVQAFASEFGVLPDQVVPALYQALSAGVPEDNVFAFLEQANKLAKGGVAELKDSVSALASVVNTYGSDMISAEEVSDALFTTVKLGVTTIPELAGVISRVAVPASAAGVAFDEVTAALAAMTKQGTPTAEAATQLRAMINELSKEGQVAYDNFKRITGESFPEFIAGGGTVGGALELLAADAEASGGRVNDSFGSIEAGMGALTLTSDNGSKLFAEALSEMDNAAGATDAAFETMSGGIGQSFAELKSTWQVFKQEAGERIAPTMQAAADGAAAAMRFMMGEGNETFDAIRARVQDFGGPIVTWFQERMDALGIDWSAIMDALEAAGGAAMAALELIFRGLVNFFDTTVKPAWEALQPVVDAVLAAIGTLVSVALSTITGLFDTLASLLRGDWAGAWESYKEMVERNMGLLRDGLERIWNSVKAFLGTIWQAIVDDVNLRYGALRDSVQSITNGISTFLSNTWGSITESVAGFAQDLWGRVVNAFHGLVSDVAGALGGLLDVVRDPLNRAIDFVNNFINRFNALQITIPEVKVPSLTIPGMNIDIPDWVPGMGGKSWGAGPWTIGGQTFGGQSFGVPQLPEIPHLAEGGIVRRATLAVIGESGPEAVVPLNRQNDMQQTIIVELDGRVLARAVAPAMMREVRVKTGMVGA